MAPRGPLGLALGSPRAFPTVTFRDVDELRVPSSRLLGDRTAAVVRQARTFGTGGFDARFYALGGGR